MAPAPRFKTKPETRAWALRAAGALCIIAYFFFFTWEGLRAPFCADDMMNLGDYWRHSPWRVLYAQFLLWRDFYRPMGGVFYLPIFHAFGLNPLPYHAALLGLLLGFVGLVYRLARTLGAMPIEAWTAALIVSYHVGLSNLYYETSFVYDVLCAVFYTGALLCYARARLRQGLPRARETAAFFLLFLCALNSKEMAATLPAMLLAYEWAYHGGPGGGRPLRRFAIPLAAAALTAVYVYGRVWHGLGRESGYAVKYSLARLGHFQLKQFQDLFLQWGHSGWLAIAVVWLLATYVAWRRRRPLLRFCWILILVAPLPVEFLEGRRGAVLAIPLVGWAILAAVAAVGVAGCIANALGQEPGFRRIGPQARLAIVVACFALAWGWWNRGYYVADVRRAMWTPDSRRTAQVIDEFRRLRPTVRPRSTVVFLNDPFEEFDMAFIAELWFRDPSVAIRLNRRTPLTAAELARADYLFDWRDGRLIAAGGAATETQLRHP